MNCLQQNCAFFSELHIHTYLVAHEKKYIKKKFKYQLTQALCIWRQMQFTQVNSFLQSIFKGRMQFQGLMTNEVNLQAEETKGAIPLQIPAWILSYLVGLSLLCC